MRKRTKSRILILSLVIILVTSVVLYMKMANKDYIKPLTTEEKLEDFEYLYNFISDNYPYLKVNERVNGINWLTEKEEFKSAIENATTDIMFIDEISKIISRLNNSHTIVLNVMDFPYFYSAYSDKEYESMFKPWGDILNHEKVLKRYRFDDKASEVFNQQQNYGADAPYCKTDIIIPNEVAYLKIQQMNSQRIEKDGVIIKEFLKESTDYNKLIIDIRGNTGGSDYYWIKNIIEPLIKEEINVENYGFVRTEYAKSFYEHRGTEIAPVSELDENILIKFPEEVKTDFHYYVKLDRTIKPVDPVNFNGKIYLIVDENVYSSAESFASFCKDSGFATLVGSTTGGDGIGMDPLLFHLPNSGLVIRFSGILGLNGDMTINEEVHTTPHIELNPSIGSTYERDQAIQYIIKDNQMEGN